MKLIILRGVSGSGKSTFAKKMVKEQNAVSCSTDEFFVDKNGYYEFNQRLLSEAHSWNRGRIYQAMKMNTDTIILDNTNTQKWEYGAYIEMAERFGYEVEEITIGGTSENEIKQYANRNKHGVSLDIIRKQAKRFEK